MMTINVLTNFYGGFYSSVSIAKKQKPTTDGQYRIMSMDIDKLKSFALEEGVNFHFMTYPEIDDTKDYSGQFFIYTSSEDPGLVYKGYLEDVLFGLQMRGAILIPEWKFMRAHHNKVMMEKLRDIELSSIDTGIHSKSFGCNEDFINEIDNISFPCVYKPAAGAGSSDVLLFKDKESAINTLNKLNCNHEYTLKEKILLKKGKMRKSPYSRFRNKFVIQNFVSGLGGDYKVLIFGDKYYALSRKNRDNDFRASGSGRLNYEPDLPLGIFDFAKSIYDTLNVPILSLDIAHDGNRFYLIEFQCLNFGTATLEYSTHYYRLENGHWIKQEGPSILEKEFVISLKRHILKKFNSYE
jgi:glutathione synthase/RimK-type ligase-like ATP-grasp enzyme